MNQHQPWYVGQRAVALAIVYLTRRNDLVIREEHQQDAGLDFVVEIVDNGRPTKRVFGIQLKAMPSISAEELATKTFITKLQDEQRLEELPFPVCLFLFSVEDNSGFYKWVAEPVVTTNGAPKLRFNVSGAFRKLSTEALEAMIADVNHWYDALVTALAA